MEKKKKGLGMHDLDPATDPFAKDRGAPCFKVRSYSWILIKKY
jgi:hypothetical protein